MPTSPATSRRCATRATGSIPVVEHARQEQRAPRRGAAGCPGQRRRLACRGRPHRGRGYWLAGNGGTAAAEAQLRRRAAVRELESQPDDAFFAAGMQDEIVSQLTKISGLRVFPVRPSAGAHGVDPGDRRGLNVATTLGGSVYYSDGRVRVTPHLTEAATGESLWSETYERELRDIFAIQSEIALEVAQALSVELSLAERDTCRTRADRESASSSTST